jgi:hypothetical protein
MKLTYQIASYLVIATGIIHIGRTTIVFDEIKVRVWWYIATGLLSVFIGFLNISNWRSAKDDKLVKWLCLSANFISFIFFLLALIFATLYDHFIEVAITVVLFAFLTFSSFYFSNVKGINLNKLSHFNE